MSAGAKTTCTRCLNDGVVRGIRFDEEGVCSYCREYETWRPLLTDWERLRGLWLERVERHRGRGADYDALVGLSGGKDSTYVLHQLVRVHGLRVLAFTIDNGFLNEWARDRIGPIVEALGVDHEFVELPRDLLVDLYRRSVAATAAPCTACSLAIYAATIELASERGIPMAVHGRSRPQMFRHLSFAGDDPFTPFVRAALEPPSESALEAAYAEVVRRLHRTLPLDLVNDLLETIVPALQGGAGGTRPEFLPYFVYHPYDERAMVELLEREIGWKRPEDYDVLMHFDCDAHDAAAYLYELAEGRPHLLPELSVMIREGQLTREAATEHLAKAWADAPPDASLQALARFVGLASPDDLLTIAEELHHRSHTEPGS